MGGPGLGVMIGCFVALLLGHASAPQATAPLDATVTIDLARTLSTFEPRAAWGAALDGHELSQTSTAYTPKNIAAMQSAGFGPVTYRLRTELAIETWHWNPDGRWSDAAHAQGYWISSDTPAQPIEMSFGYRLPRRGRTVDDASNDGYSRIDDGDTTTFWKSNPYLDRSRTPPRAGERPQWIAVDLGTPLAVNMARIAWGAPFARRYVLEYWDGDQTQPIDYNPDGKWVPFPQGTVMTGRGGTVDLRLSAPAVTTRFLRMTLFQSSHTASGGNGDPRDSLGFAVRELSVGLVDSAGHFTDLIRHGTSAATQSEMLVSSTDPWHRATDRDTGTAQPGLDLVFRSGLTHGLPMLVPVGLLFDTPENAAAELRYLRARGYPVERMELGEEPDGQRVTPEDYASLYLQFAKALHAVDPRVALGGPSFQNLLDDPLSLWPPRVVPGQHTGWIGRFLDALDVSRARKELRFLSFEWYPFDDICGDPAPHLAAAPTLLAEALARLKADGVPDALPKIMTEYGYSAHGSPVEVDVVGALFNTDLVGRFLALGGKQAYVFGLEPGELIHEPGCAEWGNNMLLLADRLGQAQERMPAYHAMRMLTSNWADSGGGVHRLVATRVTVPAASEVAPLLSAFALRRPDGRLSLLLVNRDPAHAIAVAPWVHSGPPGKDGPMKSPMEIWQYSNAQYRFVQDGEFGHPDRNLPPMHELLDTASTRLTLPPYSITVIVGRP